MLVYIGYDNREDIAFKVAQYSIKKHSRASEVIPLIADQLRAYDYYMRTKDLLASTDFSLTRYLVPFIARQTDVNHYYAVFCDCDILCTENINDMAKTIDPAKAVHVVQHEYEPKTDTKMDGATQHKYYRKNWYSVVVWTVGHPALDILTPEYINSPSTTPADLHQFRWIDDKEIGELPEKWNHLVGEYKAPDGNAETLTQRTMRTPSILHYTLGGVWMEEPGSMDYAKLWQKYRAEMEHRT